MIKLGSLFQMIIFNTDNQNCKIFIEYKHGKITIAAKNR